MQVEHISLGGNTAIRDTAGIAPETVLFFRPFQIKTGEAVIPVQHTGLSVKVTSATEGALFDIKAGQQLAFTNVCCFESENSGLLFDMVLQIHKSMGHGQPRLPVLDRWIYTISINATALSPSDQIAAGEIELYIYHALFLART